MDYVYVFVCKGGYVYVFVLCFCLCCVVLCSGPFLGRHDDAGAQSMYVCMYV
jgi:hypothetical protein